MHAIVCQSYRERDVPGWIRSCMESVEAWTRAQGWEYHFIGDDILDLVPKGYRVKADGRWPVLTDYGRLAMLSKLLDKGYTYAVWLDADVLVFDPAKLAMPLDVPYAFGREVWVQRNADGALQVRRNVHNAVLMFKQGNPVLDFYRHASARVMIRMEGGFPDQVVGPKLLGALNSLVGFPLIDTVGVLSPMVVRDIIAGDGDALRALRDATPVPLAAANLCLSKVGTETDGVKLDDAAMATACARLLKNPELLGRG